mgnify:CR=1 FL=1
MNKVNDKMQKCSFCGAMASENDDNVLIQSKCKSLKKRKLLLCLKKI